jgi:hypothetical protein
LALAEMARWNGMSTACDHCIPTCHSTQWTGGWGVRCLNRTVGWFTLNHPTSFGQMADRVMAPTNRYVFVGV